MSVLPITAGPASRTRSVAPWVNWRWVLANSDDMSAIAELDSIQNRQIMLSLNSRESANFSISIFDPVSKLIKKIKTCIQCYRNDQMVWSGPVWTKQPTASSTSMQVGCLGWFEILNHRLLRTGADPGVPPNSPSSTATSMQYVGQDQCAIAADLVMRAIYDGERYGSPSYLTLGNVPTNTQTRNLTVQQWVNIGQQITQISQIEAGFDFRVHPLRRTFDMFYDGIWPLDGPYTVQGRGRVRPDAIFGYRIGPANLADVSPNEDASKVANDVIAVGQYGIGEGTQPASILENGLFTTQSSLPDVVTPDILIAFANAEAFANSEGIDIYTFDQLPYTPDSSVLQPFVDFDIGDFGYLMADYGSIQIPDPDASFTGLQPVRLFAFNIGITDEGTEQVTQFQTVFQSQA